MKLISKFGCCVTGAIAMLHVVDTVQQAKKMRKQIRPPCKCGSRENKRLIHTVQMCAPREEWDL